MQALVIGGGVIGLTTALVLIERGWRVTIVVSAWAPNIVSSVAAAIWHPYQADHPQITAWSGATAARLRELVNEPEAGVRLVVGYEFHRRATPPPAWAASLPWYRAVPPEHYPPGLGIVEGYCYEVPLIETPIYMAWLHRQVAARGATLLTYTVSSLEELGPEWDIIVNCTGLGARQLVGDTSMYPIRGQIVKVAPGTTENFLFDEDDLSRLTYIIPRTDGTILGGTVIADDWDTTVRPETTEVILRQCRDLLPALANAEILDVLVGLRPGRPQIRLEREIVAGRPVIHNYGHGGSGYTLSWGCAEDVAQLASF